MPSRKLKRCNKGTRRCFFSRKCVTMNKTKRAKRCAKGEHQCADRRCYRKRVGTRASTR